MEVEIPSNLFSNPGVCVLCVGLIVWLFWPLMIRVVILVVKLRFILGFQHAVSVMELFLTVEILYVISRLYEDHT